MLNPRISVTLPQEILHFRSASDNKESESMPERFGYSPIRRPTSTGPDGIVRVMPGAGAVLRSRQITPLSAQELAEAERVALRLHAELGRLIGLLPPAARGASSMSRQLGVLRVTCQRVVSAAAESPGSVTILSKLPGVEGLRQFLEGLRRAGLQAADIESGESAVEQFEQLIAALAGSHTKLVERLGAPGVTNQNSDAAFASADSRRGLFETAAQVTGRACDVALSVYAFRESPERPGVLEHAMAKGLIGSLVSPGGMPMVLSSGNTLATDDQPGGLSLLNNQAPRGRTPEAILKPFTSDPLPMVTSRGDRGKLLQVVDPAAGSRTQSFDVVTAIRGYGPMIDPETNQHTLDAVWSLVSCPTRRLILDVFLHRGIERQYRPSIEAQLWNPGLSAPPEERWVTRLPAQPRLQLLGNGLTNAGSELYPRHAELTRYFFDHIRWDPSEFVGFRCEVVWPIWRAGYAMFFEHVGQPSA